MAAILACTGIPCHMIQLVLSVFYMHAFTNLNVIILLSNIFSQMIEFMVQQSVYHENCKYGRFGTQNICAMQENRWKALYELNSLGSNEFSE